MRKHGFPSRGNLKRKAELEEKRRLSGALPDEPPKVSMLEKLLRNTHGIERGTKGFGYGYGKGKGKKGGKGKDFFKGGKDSKGKGKGKGKKGKGKGKKGPSWFGYDAVETPEEVPEEHPTAALPLPSVVANCVPLEAPFAAAAFSSTKTGTGFKLGRGPCRFFERGFCYHGQNCQYEHGVASAANSAGAQAIGNTAWWVLPSTLANRVGRPGEGPAGGAFGPVAQGRGRLRATHVAPYIAPDQRERRDGLLRRLLRLDVDQYYSAILQCVRYIVNTDFLRLERPVAPIQVKDDHAESSAGPVVASSMPSTSCDNGKAEDSETKAADVVRTLRQEVVNPVDAALLEEVEHEELDDTDIAELAEVLS